MRMVSSMPSIPSIGEQYANAASYAREKGVAVDGDQETFGQRLTEVLCACHRRLAAHSRRVPAPYVALYPCLTLV